MLMLGGMYALWVSLTWKQLLALLFLFGFVTAKTLLQSGDEDEVEVMHAEGTTGCPHVGWKGAKAWYQEQGHAWPRRCQVKGCGRDADVGAHVIFNGNMHIMPCCRTHNTSTRLNK